MSRPLIEVAKREFIEHILSWRFLIALGLASLMLVTSVIALTITYREDVEAYNQVQDDLSRTNDAASLTALEIDAWVAKPNILAVFVGGPGENFRRQEASGPVTQYSSTPSSDFAAGQQVSPSGLDSPTNTRFPPLDLGFVSIVVMTFMAVIFSFDAISGERERGTLKLMLANPVPKDSILIGKYLGGMASILLSFLIAFIVALAALSFTGTSVPADARLRLGVILGLVALLVSAFYLAGLFVSSLCKRSSTSLLSLILVWLVLVFAVGNIGGIVAKSMSPSLTTAEYDELESAIDDEAFAKLERYQAEIDELLAQERAGSLTVEGQARLSFLQGEQQRTRAEAETARGELAGKQNRKLADQLRNAESLASISPAESFRSLSTSIARSDYWDFKTTIEAAVQYQHEVDRLYAEHVKDHPDQGGSGFVPPHFDHRPATLGEQVSSPRGLRDLGSLLAFNLIAFAGAYVAFLRYDVR